jgi:hypothetical protein
MRHADYASYRSDEERLLHVYGPGCWHDESFLVGNRAALEDLQRVVAEALETGSGLSLASVSDGEGFALVVILEEDRERFREAELPYGSELSADKRLLEERLTPSLLGSDGDLHAALARWRSYRPEQMVRLLAGAEDLDQKEFAALLALHAPREREPGRLQERLLLGERPVIFLDSPEHVQPFLAEAKALGIEAEPFAARRGSPG